MPNNEVPVFVRVFGDVRDVSKQLDKAKKDVSGWVGAVESATLKASVSFGAVGLGLESVALGALRSSANFESLNARILAVTKNAAQAQRVFDLAVQSAAVTPFSVNQFVQAASTLTAFRQNAAQVTPVVADLAAAMGVPLQDAAVVFGKALSGSREGFQSLHERAGIAAQDLKAFGAQLDASGSLALGNAAQIEAARQALIKYSQIQFGGTAAAMADTLSGKYSNLQDAIEVTAAKYADKLAPAAKATLDVMTGFVSMLGNLPPWFQTLAATITVGGGALALFGSGAVFVYGKMLAMSAELSALALRIPAVGSAVASVAGALSGSLGPALSSVSGLMAAAGPYVLVFAAALAVGELALYSYKSAIDALDKSITQQAKNQVLVSNSLRGVIDVVNKAAGGEVLKISNDVPKFQKDLAKAFDTTSPEKLVTALEKAGYTLDSVRNKLQQVDAQSQGARDNYMALKTALDSTIKGQISIVADGTDIEKFFDKKVVSIEEARKKLAEFRGELNRIAEAKSALQAVESALQKFVEPLAKAIEHAKNLDAYLKFADKARDAKTMVDQVKTLKDELQAMQAAAKQQGLPTERAGILQQLKTAQGTRKQFLEELITKIDQVQGAEKRYLDYTTSAEAERLKQIDRRREREEALTSGPSTKSQKLSELDRERTYLERRLALTKDAANKEIALEKALNAARGTSKEAELSEQLAAARTMADEELKTRSRLRSNKKATVEVKAGVAREDLSNILKGSSEQIDKLRDSAQGNAQTLTNAYEGVLGKIAAWSSAHKDLIANNDELRTAVSDAQRQIRQEIEQTKQALKAENFQSLRSATSEAIAGEANVRGKIALTNQAILSTEQAVKREVIGRKEGLAEIASLKKSLVDLTRQEGQIEARDRLTGLNEQKAAFDQEIQILEQRQAAGENVENHLQTLRKQRLQASLDAINLEAQAEVAAGRNADAAEATRSRKVDALIREEYLKELAKYNQQEQAHKDHLDRLDQAAANRLGGKKSPLHSFEETFNQAGQFGFSDFNLNDTTSRLSRAKPPTPQEVATKLGLDVSATKKAGQVLAPVATGAPQQLQTVNVHLNASVIPPDVESLAKDLGVKLARLGREKSLTTGSGAPPMTKGQR